MCDGLTSPHPPVPCSTCPYDPFDVTKVWSHDDFPLYEYGRLVLNRNVDNYHRDVEQAAFSPGTVGHQPFCFHSLIELNETPWV